MAANKRTKAQRERDLAQLAEWAIRGGRSQGDMAAELGISRTQVQYDLAELYGRWQANQLSNMTQVLAVQLARIDALEARAWEELDASREERLSRRVVDKEGAPTKGGFVDVRTRAGSSDWGRVIAWCISERTRLLGLAAVAREVTGSEPAPGGEAVLHPAFDPREEMSESTALAVIRGLSGRGRRSTAVHRRMKLVKG